MTVEVVMMSGLVVDESAVVHGSKHASTGTDPIPLGTTSAAGILQLASTGVPAATKPVRALGDDVAALLTAAGYTLTPATGANSMDGIADGDTYARTLKTIADALNAETYDAPKCTAFGIGGASSEISDFNTFNKGGNGSFTHDTLHLPSSDLPGFPDYGVVLSIPYSNSDGGGQIAIGSYPTPGIAFREKNSTWGAWRQIWSSLENGGQPPAPKPNTTAGAIGQVVLTNSVPGSAYSLPSGGMWFYAAYLFSDTTSTYNGFLSGIAAGGTEILAASTGNIWRGFAWRVA